MREIKYWQFSYTVKGEDHPQFIDPVKYVSPVGDIITIFNGFGEYTLFLDDLEGWSLIPIYEEDND